MLGIFSVSVQDLQLKNLPNLHLSPIGCVPQRKRRPRVIVDYTYSGVNEANDRQAHEEAMQFGGTLKHLLFINHNVSKMLEIIQLYDYITQMGYCDTVVTTVHEVLVHQVRQSSTIP